MNAVVLLAVAMVAGPPQLPEAIEAPARVEVVAGRMARFKVKSPSPVKWVNLSPEVDLHAPADGKCVAVVVAKAGRYRVAGLACGSGGLMEPAYVDLVCTGAEADPKTPPPPVKPDLLNPRKAIVRLSFAGKGCTATVIGPRRPDGRWDILTASHCTDPVGGKGRIITQDGNALAVTVTARDTTPDLTWLVTDASDLELSYALLADRMPAIGSKVWHAGYGTDRPGNVETGEVASGELRNGMVTFNLSVSPGDSGGGIFDAESGRLLGAVCCTSGMARKAAMYAGGPLAAARLRPGRASWRDDTPATMPIVTGWQD